MEPTPRVAFFPDSFSEVNGVAHTARQYAAWAGRADKPFLCVHGGGQRVRWSEGGSVRMLELPRGFASFALDKDLRYDPLWARHAPIALKELREFRPDVVHITGPSEVGVLGALLAHRLGVPLVASWHTNVHEYAATRARWMLRALPPAIRPRAAARIEKTAWNAAVRLYRTARLLFAPNPVLCALLAEATGRPCLPMARGIDAEMFTPAWRTAPPPEESRTYTLGYVGRFSVEKNVALLPRIARELRGRGFGNVRFLLAGQGVEEGALRLALPNGTFAGVLRGEALAEAYANMDCFVFPSHTDTFGNVVLEALASGVPAVVTPDGGPAHIVRSSQGGGLIAPDGGFTDAIASLLGDRDLRGAMSRKARMYAETASWEAVFGGVYAAYERVL